MNREIKFRGIDIRTGDWVYGDLNCFNESRYISNQHVQKVHLEEVYPSTVGQYTGLKDKHGKEIYEGDIVVSQGQLREYKQVVEFWNNRKSCGRGWIKRNLVQLAYLKPGMTHYKPEQEIKTFSYFELSEDSSCEIIGSIHTTPELLNQEQ